MHPTPTMRIAVLSGGSEYLNQPGAFVISWNGGTARGILQQWWHGATEANWDQGEWRNIPVELQEEKPS